MNKWFVVVVLWHLISAVAMAKPLPQPIAEFKPGFAWRGFETTDALGRNVHFYLTLADANDSRPLVVAIQGSGCTSVFQKRDDKVFEGWQALVRKLAADRVQVLVVEKPGVNLFDRPENPGSAKNCSPTFRHEHNKERWLMALRAAIAATIEQRGKSPQSIMAIGQSEGAVFAPLLAGHVPAITHVASLAANPMSQLHDFFEMAVSGMGFIAQTPGTKQDHVQSVLQAYETVMADPANEEKLVFGHPHTYWADKFAPLDWSLVDASKARFFLAHGENDDNSSVRAFDTFAIELLIRRRDITWLRIPGVGHSFMEKDDHSGKGLASIIGYAMSWFANEPFDRSSVIWPLPPKSQPEKRL